MNSPSSTNYYAYLLRVWRTSGKETWRATLENPHTGEIIGFASLPQLFDFIEEKSALKLSLPKEDLNGLQNGD